MACLVHLRSFYKIGDRASCVSIAPLINDPEKDVHDEAIMLSGLLRCEQAVVTLTDIYESGVKERKKVLEVITMRQKVLIWEKVICR